MKLCLHKWFFDYDIDVGWRTLVFHKCAKCGKVWRVSAKERIDQGAMCSQCRKQLNYCT